MTSFKLFMAYPGVFMVDDATIFRAMQRTGEIGALICMHAENGGVIDVLVQQALSKGPHRAQVPRADAARRGRGRGDEPRDRLAEMADVPVYIVHLSAQRALERGTRGARSRPAGLRRDLPAVPLPARTTIYEEPGFEGAQVRDDPAAARAKGNEPGCGAGCARRPAGGLHRPLPVLHEGAEGARARTTSRRSRTACRASRRACTCSGTAACAREISMNRFVEITATAPAKIFGLYPKKGTIAVGADADIVVFDPEKKQTLSAKTLHMRVDYTPYEGREVQGAPDTCSRAAAWSTRAASSWARRAPASSRSATRERSTRCGSPRRWPCSVP